MSMLELIVAHQTSYSKLHPIIGKEKYSCQDKDSACEGEVRSSRLDHPGGGCLDTRLGE